jgi:phosphoribosylanthranilate isomerase
MTPVMRAAQQPIVQIYTMQSPHEALACIDAGAQHIGVTPSARRLPGEIDLNTAQAIFSTIQDRAVKVALSVETELDAIADVMRVLNPDVVHVCPPTGTFTPHDITRLRAMLHPHARIMHAVSVADHTAVDEALAFAPVVDYLILDTSTPTIAGIGASGKTHDWNISREIVQRVSVPIVLAGGLSPENVADAIRAVRPFGVDSLTHTNRMLEDRRFVKDIDKVRAFVQAARGAEA